MNKYLEVMLCIWVTMAVFRLSIDFWTTKFRYKTNSELMDRFYTIDVNIGKAIDYYERERGYK